MHYGFKTHCISQKYGYQWQHKMNWCPPQKLKYQGLNNHIGDSISHMISMRHAVYDFTQNEIKPMWSQIEPNIENFKRQKIWEKNQNSSLGGGDLWWSFVISYHVIGHLWWQSLPNITKIATMTLLFKKKKKNTIKPNTTKFESIFKLFIEMWNVE